VPMHGKSGIGKCSAVDYLPGDVIVIIHIEPQSDSIFSHGALSQRAKDFHQFLRTTAGGEQNGNLAVLRAGWEVRRVHGTRKLGSSVLEVNLTADWCQGRRI